MPMPLSATVKVSRTRPRPALADRAEKPMRPRSVNFTALSIRFSSALRSRTSSPRRRSGQSPAMSISVSSALPCARAISDAATDWANPRGENGSSRSTMPPESALAASTTRVVSFAR